MMTLGIISQSDAIAPIACSVADFYRNNNDNEYSRSIALLPIAEDLHITDYSLIRMADAELSPASALLYAMMEQQIDELKK